MLCNRSLVSSFLSKWFPKIIRRKFSVGKHKGFWLSLHYKMNYTGKSIGKKKWNKWGILFSISRTTSINEWALINISTPLCSLSLSVNTEHLINRNCAFPHGSSKKYQRIHWTALDSSFCWELKTNSSGYPPLMLRHDLCIFLLWQMYFVPLMYSLKTTKPHQSNQFNILWSIIETF